MTLRYDDLDLPTPRGVKLHTFSLQDVFTKIDQKNYLSDEEKLKAKNFIQQKHKSFRQWVESQPIKALADLAAMNIKGVL